ncbi:PAS domain-containing sensor histidine kinase [Sporomusa termitida]|uniref:histidine kinase n=1 Tax=Sporomusa termitida TaxID=2377 RepID=A0A517DVB9_9FIRM|nr:ATP-binding protein [Sporomusa termitida]QDR81267.1 Adaptive-response sensory-kinase SasA [Sporomusa termitida]
MDKQSRNVKTAEQKGRKRIENTKGTQTADYFAEDIAAGKIPEGAECPAGYQDLFDNLPNGCAYYRVLFDAAGNSVDDLIYTKVNSAYAANIGRPRSELIGKRVTEVFPHLTETSRQWLQTYIKVALSGEPVAFTQYSDQQDKWYAIAAYSPQRGHVVEISEDITERKQAEANAEQYMAELAKKNRELTATQSRYRGLLDHMQEIFEYHRVIADDHGQPVDLEFAEVNPAFEMRTGLKVAEVVGKRLPVVNHGIDKATWIKILGDVELTGQPIMLEQYSKNTDSWYRVSAYSPEKGHVASILEDITEQKKAEIQKSANQKQVALIERVAWLGALASGVAHEINQPLQALKIMADGMIYWHDKGKETSIEKVIENCRGISVQAGYITAILEWMQDSVNRAWSHTPEAVDLNKMIKQAISMVQERLRAHSIQLRENNTCTVSPTVWGDVRRLEEIVIIILVNAIESFEGVDQAKKEIVITTSCTEEKAVIEISNNGPPIPEEIIGKIFKPFFSSAKSGSKLGMGLSIVKSIVNIHNGTIQVASLNQQVTFRIEFPQYGP